MGELLVTAIGRFWLAFFFFFFPPLQCFVLSIVEKSCGPKAVWPAWPLSIDSAKVTGRTGVRGVFTVFLAKLGSHCR